MPPSSPPASSAAGPGLTPSAPPELSDPSGLYLIRTLVLDADVATRDLLAEVVGNAGHQLTLAHSPEDALHLVAAQAPDCLVLKLRQAWSAPLDTFLRSLAQLTQPRGPHVIAVVLEDAPPQPTDWLRRGVHDIVIGLNRGQDLVLRLAVAARIIAGHRLEIEARHHGLTSARNFENLFRSAPACSLIVAARDGLILESSEAAASLLGLAVHEVRDRFVSLLIPGLLGRDDVFHQWDEATGPLRLHDLVHRRPDGTSCELEVTVGRCFWSDRPALCLQLHEVGAQRRAQADALRDARLEASRAMAAGAASSLNDALTAIRGNLDLLAKQNTPRSEAQSLLENAADACQRAESTIQSLAGLARTGNAASRLRPADLRPLLNRWIATALLRGRAQFELHLDRDLPPVQIDESSLRDALLALLENAEDAMPQGGLLRVATGLLNDPFTHVAWVTIDVTDAGQGIPSEIRNRLFEPYFTTRPGHLGLGLTRAASIIAAHRGRLEFHATQGSGTTARLLLPATGPVPTPSLSDSVHQPPLSRGRILVMDDDVGIRIIVEKMLSLQGFEVFTVRDGAETITAYRRARSMGSAFDVVLLDLDVPGGMGGRECIARLRGEFPDVKALLSTGYTDDLILENHREHGFSGVLTKPFNLERLVATVTKLAQA
ncbi:MAG: response regulator [Verrucomicrobiales bacterium]